MPVVHSVSNGRCFFFLVDTGSEQTLVTPRVVEGQYLRPGRPLLTVDDNASHIRGSVVLLLDCRDTAFV